MVSDKVSQFAVGRTDGRLVTQRRLARARPPEPRGRGRLRGVSDSDEEYGESIDAALKLEPSPSRAEADVRVHVGAHGSAPLAGYKVPPVAGLHDERPREDSGKMFERKCRALRGEGRFHHMSPLLIDGDISFGSGDFAERARSTEADGYDGAWSAEVGHDPLLLLAGAATATTSLELGTGIVVAFGRSPMITATMANDVQLLSRGRLLLGLGSQIKPHIEKRYSMPWSHPAARMREYILAMRAIWSCWNDGVKLDFRGEFYRHTLMTPFFNPGPNPFGPPRVFLAAVGGLMTEVAGEVGDGLLVHPFTTERYLREVTMPALGRGLEKAGRSIDGYQVSFSGLLATGSTESELEAAKDAVRSQIAFYGSTPAYRGVLELHGWGELQTELNALSRVGDWSTMATLINDDVLSTFAVVGTIDEVPGLVHSRFGDVIDRFSLYTPYGLNDEHRRAIIAGLRAISA